MLERKRKILNNFLGRSYKSNEEYLYKCPKCGHHKRKLSVNFDKNVFKCWICDYSGKNIFYLVRSHGSHSDKQDWKKVANIVDFSEQEKEIQNNIAEGILSGKISEGSEVSLLIENKKMKINNI